MIVHVVRLFEPPDAPDPWVFEHRLDAEAFAQVRWGIHWADVASVTTQSVIDAQLAQQMIQEELDDE